jgi:small-conductance mechanosensitive channel
MKWVMTKRQWIIGAGLLVLIVLAAVGLYLTRDSGSPASQTRSRRPQIVDEGPIRTARSLAALASSRAEQRLAQQAIRLADHTVDLAFATAMRDAAAQQQQATPETKELYARVRRAEAQVKTDQELIDGLKKEFSAAKGSQMDLQQQLDLVQAQMELDQDELEDAKGDLFRSGADPLSRIQRQFAKYQAAQHDEASPVQTSTGLSEPTPAAGNFLAQFSAWRTLRPKALQLQQARDEALQAHDKLQQQHDALENQQAGSEQPPERATEDKSQTVIATLRRLADREKSLADLDKRIQDHQQLGDVYGNWLALVQSRQRAALHSMLRSALWILLILMVVYLVDRVIDRLFAGLTPERKRLHTLRVVVRFAVQALGALLILFVVLGVPAQMPTILGLAGAGLTVALKDFIIAFFGWFVLMGRNGIRVGDWVEINGVMGEVVEIGLLRTVLFETGNWTDSGHPTGRKVAFMNGFAIEGHFFNFSTSGQWLWDELQILVPAGQDPYPIIEKIQTMVTKETETSARGAEQEWQRTTGRYRVKSTSAAPAINLRPTTAGVEVHVRYITRANDRYAMRTHLYQTLVDLLHGKTGDRAKGEAAPVSAGTD